MNHAEIKHLLEKYFDGNTSLAEEEALRKYFLSSEVADDLLQYKPIFAYFAKEQYRDEEESIVVLPAHRRTTYRSIVLRIVGSVAACAAIILGIFFFSYNEQQPAESEYSGCSGTYVMIEGECYNDLSLVFSHAAQTIEDLDVLIEQSTVNQPGN